MNVTDIFIRRPILALVVSLLILLAGLASIFSLPVRQYPYLENATINITTTLPGATQEVMQGFVTTPISQSIATASGIEYLSSTTTQGRSEIKARLVLNANADRAMTEILAKVQQVKYQLPAGVTDPVISKSTEGGTAVQYVAFYSDTLTIPQVTDFVNRVALPMFAGIPGVGSVDTNGGQTLALRIWIDPVKLAARGLSAGEIAAALRTNNVQSAPGQLKSSLTVTNISAATDLRSVEDFRQMVVKSSASGGVVRLSDVATVEIGGQNYDNASFASGIPAVFAAIFPTPDGNPLDIARQAQELVPRIRAMAPPGLQVKPNYDVAKFVNASIAEVQHTLIEAIVIVIAVIFLFLGTFRAVIIPVVTIPLSLVGTAALMLAFGFSINLLTLLAMVLAIGLVVDDAIVVVENIHRHIEEGASPARAALLGAREIVGPVIAMTITLAAVYAPIGLMGGLTGALFKEFAFTLAGSVIVSGVVALTLSPVMSSMLLSPKQSEARLARLVEHTMEGLTSLYRRLLARTLAARSAVLLVGVAVLGAIVVLFVGIRHELAPVEDQGAVIVIAKAPQYAGVSYTSRYAQKIEKIFESLPEFDNSFMHIGGTGRGQNQMLAGAIFKDWSQRSRSSIEIQGQIQAAGAGIDGETLTAVQVPPLPGSSGGLPVQMVLRSPDGFPALFETAEQIKAAAYKSGLFLYVQNDLAFDSPQAHVAINSSKAREMGVTMQAIADTLAVLVGENYVNRFNFHDRSYDVIPQVRDSDRMTPDDLGRFYVKASSGALVPLSTVVHVETRPQANGLTQFGQMNSATVELLPRPGVSMGEAVAFLQSQPLPAGTSVDWLSDSRQFVQEGNRLLVSFGFALVVIFLVLAAQFESLRDPLVILVTVPLAVCGALVPLWLGYATLNIYTQIGLVTLIGLISKHGILMVTFANHIQQHENLSRLEAIEKAAAVRMRPVLMTTAAMVAGLVPLVFAEGAGSASRFSIGIVVVMGMLIGTLFTLFVLPTIYSFIAKDHRVSAENARQRELASVEVSHAS
ncbi:MULTISPECIES: efflux RND transporter permease subunit [Pseudomonadota]|uniref:efflux RND transporter permease subunit n=1 Tax=Pseudomonadota TaxID=1224 RepID=UPI0022708F71|nr:MULTISPECIES: efflux RND transporter permease subunit [Pseudomonadota]MCY0316725.1 efflux RND transporter permease subunit [Pseudomonas aeruginosa]MCY0322774.1 efflux RND transporter permease subunit [Pseudomonas aeruginosa]MCY0390311.1 efflux RND transporter permease subunit [Pseudomonas aeruginosa]MCY0432711.1 efflux RND transporter permease subunit [Pseudomonas aeruginosa]MDI4137696.1 efflux RND transporter permease subunit [Pseudomonas aeruginosa]